MKTKEEKYAEGYRCPATNENEYCKHDIISAYNNGYTQCQEDMKPLLEDLFSLWQSLAEVGEIGIGQNFTKKYEELKNSLNKQD